MKKTIELGKKTPKITGAISDIFIAELGDIIEDPDCTELVLDFEGADIINSMTMGAIFAAFNKMNNQGKSLRIVNSSEKIIRLMRMVNLDHLLEL